MKMMKNTNIILRTLDKPWYTTVQMKYSLSIKTKKTFIYLTVIYLWSLGDFGTTCCQHSQYILNFIFENEKYKYLQYNRFCIQIDYIYLREKYNYRAKLLNTQILNLTLPLNKRHLQLMNYSLLKSFRLQLLMLDIWRFLLVQCSAARRAGLGTRFIQVTGICPSVK